MNDIAFDKFLGGCVRVALLLLLAFGGWALFMNWSLGVFSSVPSGHDSRLFGWWKGQT